MKSPVLFLVFNRPETTRRVFGAIRSAQPSRLYVVADGARDGRSREQQLCDEVRHIVSAVDWPCEVKTRFRQTNLGCKAGVADGINWFFRHENEGIILEDDIFPSPTFFPFCDEMLERYRDEPRVSMISGCNLISSYFSPRESYFFSRYNHIWGWASWRRAWAQYDVNMAEWPAYRDGLKTLPDFSRENILFKRHWRGVFNAAYDSKVDTWDYQWTFAIWKSGGLTVLPAINQTSNLGFSPDATHTTQAAPAYVIASRPGKLRWPLVNADVIERNVQADNLISSRVFDINFTSSAMRCLHRFRSLGSSPFR